MKEIGETSDGYHTFNELYEHRHLLFLNLMRLYAAKAWISKNHDDGTSMDGWFIAGIHFNHGDVSYHLPNKYWLSARMTGALELDTAPAWDGHTSEDVIDRLQKQLLSSE